MNCENCNDDGGFCEPHGIEKSARRVHLCQTNPKYRKAWDEGRGPRQPPDHSRVVHQKPERPAATGPGTELKKLLARFGIRPKGCACNGRAAEMDRRGPAWCRDNIDTLTGWLLEEGRKRQYSLVNLSRPAVKVLIRWAITRSERKHN